VDERLSHHALVEELQVRPDKTIGRPKTPAEQFRIAWNFVDDLAAGDTVLSQTITAIKVSDASDASATFLDTPLVASPEVSVTVKAGSAGEDYDVVIRATTATGEVFERVIRVPVRA
jgi:hypothetical protein